MGASRPAQIYDPRALKHCTGCALLCLHCNVALGNAGDSIPRLLALAAYLRRHRA